MPVSDHLGLRNLAVDRASLVEWYLRNRERSRRLFDLIDPEVYYTRPIALRNPIVFYEGHLPAFSVIAFLQRGLGHSGVDERLERLFARGIDPDSVDAAVPRSGASTLWPDRKEVLAFGAAADEAVLSALRDAPFVEDRPAMLNGDFSALLSQPDPNTGKAPYQIIDPLSCNNPPFGATCQAFPGNIIPANRISSV